MQAMEPTSQPAPASAAAASAPLVPTPCIVCRKALRPVFPGLSDQEGSYQQPSEAVTFSSKGNYGSTVFDSFDGHILEANVCDACLAAALLDGRAKDVPPT